MGRANSNPYQPADRVLDRLHGVDFVAVVGPSAAGKTTLINALLAADPAIRQVLTHSSREPRPGERDGVDFHHEPRPVMERRIAAGEYVQVVSSVLSDIYATAPEDYVTDGIALMPVMTDAVETFRALPFRSMQTVFVLPADFDVWYARLDGRQLAPEQRVKRLAEAARSLRFAAADSRTVIVVNGELTAAVAAFAAAVHGRLDKGHMAVARALAADFADRLDGISD